MAINGIHLALVAIIFLSVPNPSQSHTCKSPDFTHCLHLTQHNSQIHYTYNATNASLSIAFTATPSKPDGWIGWSINPTSTGMAGAQAFVAYQQNSTVRTKTLNIISYYDIRPGNLSFPFWNVSAEKKNGAIWLYASLKVPENKTVVNQVWEVGPGTDSNGGIEPHAYFGECMHSKSTLSLTQSGCGNLKVNLGLILGFVAAALL